MATEKDVERAVAEIKKIAVKNGGWIKKETENTKYGKTDVVELTVTFKIT